MLKTSANGKKFITLEEGEVLKVYKDPIGLPTVGVGHLVKKGEPYKVGQVITHEESQALLTADLAKAEAAVNDSVTLNQDVSQNEFDALVSFTFNIGTAGFKRSSILKKINAGDRIGAADALLRYNKAGGKILPGLTKRRQAERKLFLTPDEVNHPPITSELGDTATLPVSTTLVSTSVTGTTDKGEVLNSVVDKVITVSGRAGELQASVSKSSWLVVLITKIGGWLLLAISFFASNPLYAIIGVVLVVAAIWYLTRSKDRNANLAKANAYATTRTTS